jgi:REP element-mobilizing transposase RayT
MPRKQRRDESGLIHHACLHGVEDELVFRSDEDRVGYVAMLAATVARYGWLCLSYCLMGNHLHLLIETPQPNFAAGMQWLHGHYARCFNKQHKRDGHLFHRGFHDEPVVTDGHLINVAAYIPANPVEAGLCDTPGDWPWGSHSRVINGGAPSWLAHNHLAARLEAITGSPTAYEAILASRLRTKRSDPKGSDPLGAIATSVLAA